ncbi:MAG: serine hydrolase domain-containing protein [Balneolales bacterium]
MISLYGNTARLACVLALMMAAAGSGAEVWGQDLLWTQPEKVGMASDRLDRLSVVLDGYVKDDKLPGGVALVARKGKIAYLKTFGQSDPENGRPMEEDAIFRIASQTKAIVSVAVMLLQEEGKLLLSDPVGRHLPAFAETTVAEPAEDGSGGYEIVKARRPVTIHDLLTHTAGISYGGGPARELWEEAGITGWYFAHRDEPVRATVDRMAALPFDAHPGERYLYGYSTDILGAVVEQAGGQPLNEFLRSRIFEPLEMQDTHFYLPESKNGRLAVVYSATGQGQLEPAASPGGMVGQGAYVNGPRMSYSGGAGLLSTAMDYASFLQMLLNGGELNGKRILSRKSVELMTVNHLGDLPFRSGEGFGLGFYTITDVGARGVPGSVGEYGWGGAYHSTYWVDPEEQLVVVYFTQLIPSGGLDDHGKLRALIYQAITD